MLEWSNGVNLSLARLAVDKVSSICRAVAVILFKECSDLFMERDITSGGSSYYEMHHKTYNFGIRSKERSNFLPCSPDSFPRIDAVPVGKVPRMGWRGCPFGMCQHGVTDEKWSVSSAFELSASD